MQRFCANISMLYQKTNLLQRYQWAAEDGFDYVECLFFYVYQANGYQVSDYETFARKLFCPHTALKICSLGHLLGVNSFPMCIFALPENKIFFRAQVSL